MNELDAYLADLAGAKRRSDYTKEYTITRADRAVVLMGVLVVVGGKLFRDLGEVIQGKINGEHIFLPAFDETVELPPDYERIRDNARTYLAPSGTRGGLYTTKLGLLAMQVIYDVDPVTQAKSPVQSKLPCALKFKGFSVTTALQNQIKGNLGVYDDGWINNCVRNSPGAKKGLVQIRCELPKEGAKGYQSTVVLNPLTKDTIEVSQEGFDSAQDVFNFAGTTWDRAQKYFQSPKSADPTPPTPPDPLDPVKEFLDSSDASKDPATPTTSDETSPI